MSDTHALNKVLADVAGIEVVWLPDPTDATVSYWVTKCEGEYGDEWDPLHDHNQMSIVEAALVAEKRELKYVRDLTLHEWLVWISAPGMFVPPAAPIKGRHDNKLIAFAMAVESMEKNK